MKKLSFIVVSIIAVFLFASVPVQIRAEESASNMVTLKVGFFNFDGYHMQDSNGKKSGYGYEFLQRLARHTDWRYEYIGYDKEWDDMLDMLKNGEIDILTSVSKTSDREKEMLFSHRDIGSKSTIFTVKAENKKVIKGDYSTYDGLTIGMIEDNSANDKFAKFALEHLFSYNIVYKKSVSELSELLEKGDIDGIVTSSIRTLGNEWLIESLDASPYFVCCNNDDPDLMEQIDAAINEMDLSEPNWRNELHDKYFSTSSSGDLNLNAEERNFLDEFKKSGKSLTTLVNIDQAPYSYMENGKVCGILPALFEEIASMLELNYSYEIASTIDEYYNKRHSGIADVILDFCDDEYIAEQEGYKITNPYFNTTFTLIKRKGMTKIKSVAVVKNSDEIFMGVVSSYINGSVANYDTLAECMEAVKNGKVDAAITYSYTAELLLWKDEKNELSSEFIGEASSSFTLGIRAMANGHLLLSVINKGVTALSKNTVSETVNNEVSKLRPNLSGGLIPFLRRNPVYIYVILFVFMMLLFAVSMLVIRTYNQRKLQKKITLATAQLEAQKSELSEALHAADAANRSKTTFLNNMSHDIRTPMNAIIGFTALATTHIDNKERTIDYLTKISQASNHLLSLINDVLDMSRIESGKVHIEERPENLADILQGLRNIIQSDIHAKNLELYIDTVDIVNEEVFCDKLRLNQIMLNLTSNAIKFTPTNGKVAIKVTQKPSHKEGYGLYEFNVSDTGIGMSPEFVKTVFDPFTRERNSTVSGIQGTGLGMAITKNIVDIMGGSIDVKSEQGKGSEFTVLLELKFSDAKVEIEPLRELNGLYSLVVDDDLVSCQSVSKMLRQLGMHAEWTVTGKEAVVRTAEAIELGHPFEVYVIDWSMPDMDGVTTVKNIRAIVGDDSPIILMSAYDWADIEKEAREAGVTDFISKPLFASDLHRTLERSLGKIKADEEIAQKNLSFAGKRILLAEDNELNREIAEEILKEAGFKVESAENGKIAYEMLLKAPSYYYDLVLMDIQMPIMNGYETSKKIRLLQDISKSEIPIIAMTANAFEEDKANAMAAGMNGHLAKPIDIDVMFKLLEKILKK